MTTVDLTNTGWTATYTENGAAVSIADTDSSIFDPTSANMTGASITLTNPQTGDRLLVNGSAAASGTLGSGITWTRTATTVTLSGAFTKAAYADAIEQVQFENTTDTPSTTARNITVTTSDGANTSNTAVTTINVTAVNDAPVVGTGSTLNYAENAAATAINTAITVSDVDSGTLSTATVSITGGFATGQDVLGFTNDPGTMGNIAGSYNATTGVMSLSSAGNTATVAQWQAALRAVQYSNSSDNPSTASRTVSYTVNDSALNSNTVASTVNVTASNDAPVVATGSTLNYTENGAASAINGVITVSDPDSGTLSTATVSITGGFATGQDVLSFTNVPGTMGNIAGSYNATTGVMSLSSAGNTATVAQWQAALRAVQYSNSSDSPSTSARTVSYTVNDSAANSNTITSTVNVTAVNDAPSGTSAAVAVTEDTPQALTAANFGFSDPDAADVLGAVRIDTLATAGALQYDTTGSGNWVAVTAGQVVSAADIGANRLRFSPAADANGAGYATFTFSVRDGTTFDPTPNTITVNVAAVNDAPVLATGSTLGYAENGTPAAINGSLVVLDVDNATLSSATVSITGGFATGQDVLSFTNVAMGNIAGSYNATTGVMTLTSAGNTATVAQWQAALRAVQYSNSSDNPSTASRTVTYQVNDSAVNSNTVASTVNVTASNDASTLTTGSTLNYTENGAAAAINGVITVADPDNTTLSTATVSITGNFATGQDVLAFTNVGMGNIAGSYNASTGVMSLSSAGNTATVAQWEAALRAVQYSNSSDNPTTSARTVSYTVNDGAAGSNTVTSTVNMTAVNDAPVVATGSTLTYAENAAATAINTAITVTDVDSGTLSTATVSITAGFATGQDVLSFTNVPGTMGNITGSYNATTGVMSLSSAGNTATVAQWQAALRAVQYSNSFGQPVHGFAHGELHRERQRAQLEYRCFDRQRHVVERRLHADHRLDAELHGERRGLGDQRRNHGSDPDNATLSTATVSITANFATGQDVLSSPTSAWATSPARTTPRPA